MLIVVFLVRMAIRMIVGLLACAAAAPSPDSRYKGCDCD
jgi:hypothetical protein